MAGVRPIHFFINRKNPNLRTFMQKKDGEWWMRTMTEERVDFEVMFIFCRDKRFELLFINSFHRISNLVYYEAFYTNRK